MSVHLFRELPAIPGSETSHVGSPAQSRRSPVSVSDVHEDFQDDDGEEHIPMHDLSPQRQQYDNNTQVIHTFFFFMFQFEQCT
jgi:hypothetical protein